MDTAPAASRPARWIASIVALLIVIGASWPAALTVSAAAPPRATAVMFQVAYADNVPQEVRAAFDASVKVWAPLLNSNVPIKVSVTWTEKGDCSSSCTLASAGASDNPMNFANAPLKDVRYPIALANSLSGQRLNGDAADITTDINSQANWYYGDGIAPDGRTSFKTTAVHELAHGLGFASSFDYDKAAGTGSWGFSDDIPLIFDRFIVNGAGQRLLGVFPNNSAELAAQLTGNALVFDGPNTRAANDGKPAKLYAPNPWERGSSISHLDQTTYVGTPNALLTPKDDVRIESPNPGPITEGLFKDLGWPGTPGTPTPPVAAPPDDTNPTPPPFKVTTGAKGGGGIVEHGAVGPDLYSYSANPAANEVFLGWILDGRNVGYAPTITLKVDKEHTLEAVFTDRRVFDDATPDKTGATEAIAELEARDIIKGCNVAPNSFCPIAPTLRAEMAVLIVRAMGWTGESPTKTFSDRNGVDDELWQAVGILATRGVVNGYSDGTFGTTSPVLNAQVIAFITRAMVKKGLWQFQPDNGTIYPNVPQSSGHRQDLVTYVHYAGAVRGTANTTTTFDGTTDPSDGTTGPFNGWNATSSRAYFAFALWQALQSYYGTDKVGLGGYIP